MERDVYTLGKLLQALPAVKMKIVLKVILYISQCVCSQTTAFFFNFNYYLEYGIIIIIII